jgi:hypothetical protein
MSCAEFDNLLADYVDDTLAPEVRAAVEQHAAECSACGELLRDVTGAVTFIGRVADVTPPPDLVTRIAFQTPVGRFRGPLDTPGLVNRLVTSWLRPMLQPRLAMGMAMTILSFAMLERCTGVHVQQIQPADLSPVRVWDGLEDRVIRTIDRAVKYYENIRLVYDVETRLRELDEKRQATATSASSDSVRQGKAAAGDSKAQQGDGKK